MSKTALQPLMAMAAIVATYQLARALGRTRRERTWNASATFLFGLGLLLNAQYILGVFLREHYYSTDAFFNFVDVFTGYSARVTTPATALIIISSILMALHAVTKRDVQPNGAAVLAVLAVLLADISGVSNGSSPLSGRYIAAVLVLIACIFLPRGRGALVGAGTLGVLMAALSGLAVAFRYSFATQPCTGKCPVVGVLISGAADNENSLALLLALTVPAVYLGFRGNRGAWLAIYVTAMTFATGDRTAAYAALIALFALLVVDRPWKWLLGFATLGAAVVMAVAPFSTLLGPDSLTGRPRLWAEAREMLHGHWVTGLGPQLWNTLIEGGVIPRAGGYSTHNQVLETIFVSGALGVIIWLLFFAVAIGQTAPAQRSTIWAVLLPVMIVGITERPISLGGLEWLSWLLPLIILCAEPRPLAAWKPKEIDRVSAYREYQAAARR